MKVKQLNTSTGEHGGWCIFCPACQYGHLFDNRWVFNGNMDKPTFRESMLVYEHGNRPRCHSYVTDGRIEFLPDSTHDLKGQTVDLPDWDDDKDW